MKKLDKTSIAQRDEISGRFSTAFDELNQAVQAFNDKMGEAWARVTAALDEYNSTLDEAWGGLNGVEPLLTAYNEVIADANAWKADIAQEIQDYIDERSDKWREGEVCARYEAWKEPYDEELQEIEIERPEDLELEEPDSLDWGGVDEAQEALDSLPEELEQ